MLFGFLRYVKYNFMLIPYLYLTFHAIFVQEAEVLKSTATKSRHIHVGTCMTPPNTSVSPDNHYHKQQQEQQKSEQ